MDGYKPSRYEPDHNVHRDAKPYINGMRDLVMWVRFRVFLATVVTGIIMGIYGWVRSLL